MKKRTVAKQQTKEIGGSVHSYENYLLGSRTNEDGEQTESVQANPDLLPENDNSPSTPQLLMGEAIGHLQGRQKETYLLTMREGKSLAEVGEILGISKSAAQVYKVRAIKFVELYCREAIARGRV